MFIVVILQTILHYLGIIGIILGIVAFLFGNHIRGKELLIGGVCFIVLKYVVGFIYITAVRVIQALKGK